MGHHWGNRGRKGGGLLDRLLGGGHSGGYGSNYDAPTQSQQPAAVLLVCPSCKSRNPESAKFCQQCGSGFGGSETRCSKCKNVLAADAKFCNECGTKTG